MASRRVVAAVVAIGFLVAGCSAGPKAGRSQGEAARALLSAQADIRKVVYTSNLSVRVSDAVSATQQATQIARDADGIVFAQDSDLEGRRETRLTLKVPPERFDGVLAALSGLGRALTREVTAQDVTAEVVDVDGRLKTGLASADRLRSLLANAGSTAEVVAVENELAKREGEIESLQGRLRVLSSQVDLATVNLRLTERGDVELNADVPPFLNALRAGWVVLINVGLVVVAAAGFSLPFLPLGALAVWAVRRHRRARTSPR